MDVLSDTARSHLEKLLSSRASTQSDDLIDYLKKKRKTFVEFYDISRVISSSAQNLQMMISSQMSVTRLNLNQMIYDFKPMS